MANLKKIFRKALRAIGEITRSPVTIDKWYGRLGNNIQQISLAIMYAQKNKRRVITPEHQLIRAISHGKRKPFDDALTRKNRFFFFSESMQPSIDVALSYEYVCNNIQRVVQEFIVPNLKFEIGEPFGQDVLVVHLRGGDIFDAADDINADYVQNPLSFYEGLIGRFRKTIVVCEPGIKNPIVSILENNPAVTIQSSSIEADFETLLRARNIATSGVGTFAIAAALCSRNLVNLFCTDRYLHEHLNPEMIREARVHCLNIGDDYIKIGEWDGGIDKIDRMLAYQVGKEYFANIFGARLI